MSLKVATIVPQAHLNMIGNDNYLMCISHIVQQNRAYAAFFRGKSSMGDYVILDNSVIELKKPESIDSVVESAVLVQADEIVLPDQSFDKEATLRLTHNAIRELEGLRGYGRMAVPHGTTKDEWLSCALTLLNELDIDTLGISYLYTAMFDGRINMIKKIYRFAENNAINIHLLGCMTDPKEVYEISQVFPLVRGVDSAIACVYAQNHIEMGVDMPARPPRKLDFANDRYDEDLFQWNVRWWKERCISGRDLANTGWTVADSVF